MLNNPKLALCTNRNILPKRNEKSGSPEDWFANDLLAKQGMVGIGLDFFVNWTQHSLTPVVWIKQVLSVGVGYDQFIRDPKAHLLAKFGQGYIDALNAFSSRYDLSVAFIVVDDLQPWNDPQSVVCRVDMNRELEFKPVLQPIEDFKALIRKNSGGAVHVGNKGLIYGTSGLECSLSHTDSAYPGDIDLLVLDNQSEPIAILEFKKHTLSADVSKQTLSDYYPVPDARKYNRLAIFKEYIANKTGRDIPIIIIFYPSNAAGDDGKIEILSGKPGTLVVKKGGLFRLPKEKTALAFLRIVNLLPKLIGLYHEQ